jgi:hypothetical protein
MEYEESIGLVEGKIKKKNKKKSPLQARNLKF